MRAASILRLLAAQAFPQSDDLRAQSLAAKLTLETDHLVSRLTGAQAREPLLVALAGLVLRRREARRSMIYSGRARAGATNSGGLAAAPGRRRGSGGRPAAGRSAARGRAAGQSARSPWR